MRIQRMDRAWTIGGSIVAIALLIVGWFVLISPQNEETTALRGRVTVAEQRLTVLKRRLAELRRQNDDLAQFQEKLASDRLALPTTPGLSDLLRELQAAGGAAGVSVSGLVIAAPAKVTNVTIDAYKLPITLTAVGSVDNLCRFLNELQQVQPRAVLINSANLSPDGKSASLTSGVTLTISLQVFIVPSGSGGTPATSAPSERAASPEPSAPAASQEPFRSATPSPSTMSVSPAAVASAAHIQYLS